MGLCGTSNSIDASVFFFLQAEDGIRDYKVTGVQTCALPICRGRGRAVAMRFFSPAGMAEALPVPDLSHRTRDASGLAGDRSEERRVGKECRSRWSPYH